MPKRFFKSFKYARAGVNHAVRTQRNLWVHLSIGILVLIAAALLKFEIIEICVLVLTIFGVIVTEMVNTAIEEMVNVLSPQQNIQAALAKNVAAAAVLVAAMGAALIGSLMFASRMAVLWAR